MEVIERVLNRKTAIEVVPYHPRYLAGTLDVAREIHAHSIYRDMPMDEEKVVRQLSASGSLVADRFFMLAVKDDEVLGGFYGCTLKVFFCDELTAKDLGWWVKDSARGGMAAILLLGAFEKWAKAQGAKKCMIGQSGVENIERTTRLFVHCGYSITGFNTCKEL